MPAPANTTRTKTRHPLPERSHRPCAQAVLALAPKNSAQSGPDTFRRSRAVTSSLPTSSIAETSSGATERQVQRRRFCRLPEAAVLRELVQPERCRDPRHRPCNRDAFQVSKMVSATRSRVHRHLTHSPSRYRRQASPSPHCCRRSPSANNRSHGTTSPVQGSVTELKGFNPARER